MFLDWLGLWIPPSAQDRAADRGGVIIAAFLNSGPDGSALGHPHMALERAHRRRPGLEFDVGLAFSQMPPAVDCRDGRVESLEPPARVLADGDRAVETVFMDAGVSEIRSD